MTSVDEFAGQALGLALDALPGAEVAASADHHRLALTRFANSVIHQNVAEEITTVHLRVHHEGRTASAAATVADAGALAGLVERAVEAVRVAPLDPGGPGLARPSQPGSTPPPDAATANATPADRAAIVRAFVDGAGGLEAAGYCRTDHWQGAFANSAGQVVAGEGVECGLAGVTRDRGADGVARHAPISLADLDAAVLGARAAAKSRAWADPIELPPGRYEVVFEPSAAADLLEALAVAGYNGKAVNERRSFVRLGEEQLDPAVTLIDDPLAVGAGYDAEGSPRRRLTLVDRGRSVAVAHDRRSAAEAGVESTGHAADARFAMGPHARHVGMVPTAGTDGHASEVEGPMADTSVAALVAGVERGVLVSDLWYTRLLDPRTLAVTGLTRNGVWLIEQGEVTTPLRNFRFTQSYAQALMPGNVLGVGATVTPIPGDTYPSTAPRWSCPALHLASWNFTGGASG